MVGLIGSITLVNQECANENNAFAIATLIQSGIFILLSGGMAFSIIYRVLNRMNLDKFLGIWFARYYLFAFGWIAYGYGLILGYLSTLVLNCSGHASFISALLSVIAHVIVFSVISILLPHIVSALNLEDQEDLKRVVRHSKLPDGDKPEGWFALFNFTSSYWLIYGFITGLVILFFVYIL